MIFGESILSQAIERRFFSPPLIQQTLTLPTIVSGAFVNDSLLNKFIHHFVFILPIQTPSILQVYSNAIFSSTVIYGEKLSSCSQRQKEAPNRLQFGNRSNIYFLPTMC